MNLKKLLTHTLQFRTICAAVHDFKNPATHDVQTIRENSRVCVVVPHASKSLQAEPRAVGEAYRPTPDDEVQVRIIMRVTII